ncbi:hypothetical protein CTKZ_23890 [Cellulomonas algicola]|uniref:DUF5067 domain-containing protein n=1 Tax=Cellulomonas algicola TaxID=2071633 RepID=A0A401V1P3_9CELL|nr:hypothetical protein [Cellulomonas algicola]GCD20827.1 hypothetical protein CTKZ_23890 [Cellulomonas algicola]
MPRTTRTLLARRRATLAALLVLAAPLAACTGGSDPDPSPTAASPSASADAGGTGGDETTVAEAEATLPKGIGTVDVAVRSLTLDGNGSTMTLRVAFTPHLANADDEVSLSEMNDFFFVHPVLLDRQNLKRYSVVEGEGVQDWLTNDDAVTRDGEPLESWFVYAAPEDDIDEITFTIDEWSVELPAIPVAS